LAGYESVGGDHVIQGFDDGTIGHLSSLFPADDACVNTVHAPWLLSVFKYSHCVILHFSRCNSYSNQFITKPLYT
jgi:hypothetical protein